jgi:hypothetical protein
MEIDQPETTSTTTKRPNQITQRQQICKTDYKLV